MELIVERTLPTQIDPSVVKADDKKIISVLVDDMGLICDGSGTPAANIRDMSFTVPLKLQKSVDINAIKARLERSVKTPITIRVV